MKERQGKNQDARRTSHNDDGCGHEPNDVGKGERNWPRLSHRDGRWNEGLIQWERLLTLIQCRDVDEGHSQSKATYQACEICHA